MTAYYNEFDPNAALWLQAAMDEGVIAKGVIDTRSIEDVRPDELREFTQCHFFAGIGGWSIALRLAGWPDDKPVWTGSCPCQPFSTAGKGAGVDDPRHLWPAWFWLIQQCRPDTVFGEQVANAITKGWLDDVAHDLEVEGYAVGSAIIPACSVGAPHKRDRLWFVADSEMRGCKQHEQQYRIQSEACIAGQSNNIRDGCTLGNAEHDGQSTTTQSRSQRQAIQHNAQGTNRPSESSGTSAAEHVANTICIGQPRQGEFQQPVSTAPDSYREANRFDDYSEIDWYACPDGKARPVKSGLCLLADGIPAKLRKAALHGFGNAIHPEVAAEFISCCRVIKHLL